MNLNDYLAVANKLHELDLDEQTIADTLEGVSGDLQEKATNVAKFACVRATIPAI